MGEPSETRRAIAENRRAGHDFEILDTLECGVELRGTEVKSLRQGKASIAEAYAQVRSGELWLIGAHIPEYAQGNIHNPRPRATASCWRTSASCGSGTSASASGGSRLIKLLIPYGDL